MPVSEYDGDRDKFNQYKPHNPPHIPTVTEELQLLKTGDSPKQVDRTDHFEGLLPLPRGLKKYKYATPRWKGSFAPEKE